jgi:uncharacterized protein (TIGR03435 family)
MQAFNKTMDQLSSRISNQLDMPVANATGLAGRYDFSWYWAVDTLEPTNDAGPSLFSAPESQLGLRLVGKKAPVTIIVVDHNGSCPKRNLSRRRTDSCGGWRVFPIEPAKRRSVYKQTCCRG